MRRSFLLFIAFCLAVQAAAPASASDSDFRLMELRRKLREHPSGEEARRDRFSLAEQYFRQGMAREAAEVLKPIHSKNPGTNEELLASVYLLRCARAAGDEKAASALEKELQESLSSRQFVGTFRPEQVRQWNSPTGNHYVFREEVDRMEITLNEKAFYTIDLS